MTAASHQNQEREKIKKQNIKTLLIVGGPILIFVAIIMALIIGLFYFHVLQIGNIVSGG
jgi:hypothetical protein